MSKGLRRYLAEQMRRSVLTVCQRNDRTNIILEFFSLSCGRVTARDIVGEDLPYIGWTSINYYIK